ncbi:inositol monophosphatase 1 isoform X2 [Arctopsyche grandis]|uniref:inositol monophosphatase 1 isoform X2 n=1 Tax=Arctopsyche grandis TaxID=121162 RepID=UPI00406D7615
MSQQDDATKESAILDEYYDYVFSIVQRCGEISKSTNLEDMDVEFKSCDVDLVTAVDQLVEKTLITEITKKYPEHKFIGEETVSGGGECVLTDEPTWIIDPIDGTMNFVHGFPHYGISVALFMNKEPKIAFVYNPRLGQMFTARKGKGAFLNEQQIFVSKETSMSKALVMSEAGTSRDPDKLKVVFENLINLIPKIHGLRTLGCAALNMCMVALGGADVNYEFGIHAWDIAAGQLLVQEAGGVCIDPSGGSFDVLSRRVLCASTMTLALEIASNLSQYYPPRD